MPQDTPRVQGGPYEYWARQTAARPLVCWMRCHRQSGQEEVVFDVNWLADHSEGSLTAVGQIRVSPCHRLVALLLDASSGGEQLHARFWDIAGQGTGMQAGMQEPDLSGLCLS